MPRSRRPAGGAAMPDEGSPRSQPPGSRGPRPTPPRGGPAPPQAAPSSPQAASRPRPPQAVPRPGPPGRRGEAPSRDGRSDKIPAAGPLGSVVAWDGRCVVPDGSYRVGGFRFGASALIMLNRVAFFDAHAGRLDDGGKRALLSWACEHKLGQDGSRVAAVAHRREAALRALSGVPRRKQRYHVRLRAEPEWRLAVGLGDNANAHEIGLALHGTYGWPVIPGSSLKGLTAAWAAASLDSEADRVAVRRVLGTPRRDVAPEPADADAAGPGGRGGRKPDAERGTVCFLDAIPAGQPVAVEADVLTPHVKPYYDSIASGAEGKAIPPAEYHNPVPVMFLTVRGAYAVDLYGRSSEDVDLAVG